MSVFKVEKENGYTVMSNYHLRDLRLSNKAIGLLSKILSLPEEWDYTTKGLAKISKDGLDSIKSAIKELEEAGYIIRNKKRESGRFNGVDYIIYEKPRAQIISVENECKLHDKLKEKVSFNKLVASGLNKKVLNELIGIMEEMVKAKEDLIISGRRHSRSEIKERILGIRKEHMEAIYDTLQSKTDLVNRKEYIKTLLFNRYLKQNEVRKRNGFHNFEQRDDIDYDDLERRIAEHNTKKFGNIKA